MKVEMSKQILKECPVCFEDTATHCVVGCDHAFCQTCVTRWCTRNAAYCPVCRQEIFGILSDTPRRVYVSPFHGPWKVRLREVAWGLEVTEADDVTRAHGMVAGSVLRVNGSHALEHVHSEMHAAFRDKRLLQVDVVDPKVAAAHQRRHYCGNGVFCCAVS